MGHSDIQQTQKYAKLWDNLIGKLEQEFTDLITENYKSGTGLIVNKKVIQICQEKCGCSSMVEHQLPKFSRSV